MSVDADRTGVPAEPSGMAVADPIVRRWSLTRVVGGFSVVNAIVMLAGLVSGPFLARALGPADRGALAAITVPLTIAPALVGMGLGAYAARASARDAPLGTVIGTVGALLLLIGISIAGLSGALAGLFAAGRDTVYVYLLIGFALMPFSLVTYLLWGVHQGLERWRPMAMTRLVPPLLGTAATAILFALGELTLGTAAAVFLSVGIVAQLPMFGVLRRATGLRFDRVVAREALLFGFPAWIATLGGYANFRLDQLLMIRLTNSAELGFYAVAATLASFSLIVTSSIQTAIVPRVARGDRDLAQRATRVTVALVAAATLLVAAVTPFVLPALFGEDFEPAVPMALILLAAGIPFAGAQILSVVLTAWGRPKASARAEVVGLAITVPGLILLIPVLGGRGAALVSLVAYSMSFAIQLAAAQRSVGGTAWSYIAPTRTDVRWARERFGRRVDAGGAAR